jgi:hypothetical protein
MLKNTHTHFNKNTTRRLAVQAPRYGPLALLNIINLAVYRFDNHKDSFLWLSILIYSLYLYCLCVEEYPQPF